MIPVTQVFLPPQEEYQQILQRAWDKKWITNRGELVTELENKLVRFLGVKNGILTTNGTLPLQIAIKALNLKGEIITTPFSYVATSSAIVWENCTPVFVDIHPEYLTIDETLIEAVIGPETSAILATHVFGNPCHVEAIENIAKKHGLAVIYDAAHAFGVKYKGKSVLVHGDISTCSFHATKLFHCGEGGALFCENDELRHRLFYMHNFGHNGPVDFHGVGINAKMSELQAAMGLAVFPYLDYIWERRAEIVTVYDENLVHPTLQKLKIREGTEWNFSYYPIILEHEPLLLRVMAALAEKEIFPRRYFYPSINTIPCYPGEAMPVSESVAARIICLPLSTYLSREQQQTVIDTINSCLS